jgi:SAM-dependent methyltransferase
MAEVIWQDQSCPLCGGAEHDVVGTRDRRGADLRTVLCTKCGHVFTNPAPSPEALATYYRDAYRQDYKQIATPKRKHVYRAGMGALTRFARLAPHIARAARVIDIGAGGGEFVYLLARRGFDVAGIEPHAGYANYAREMYGVDIKAGTLETAAFPENSADAITMHHVLEHTSSPLSALRQIWTWLKPGGIAVIEVPNLASWAHAPHHRFHKAHLHTFNRTGLEGAFINAGFEIVQMNAPGDRGHLNVVAKKVSAPADFTWRNVSAESRATLAAHTRLAHIFSGQAFRRLHASITRPLREARAIRKIGSPESGREVLDALFGVKA